MYRVGAIVLSVVAASSATLFSDDVVLQERMWADFKIKYNKIYLDDGNSQKDVESYHKKVFLDNLRLADSRNALERRQNNTDVHGITQFMDLTPEDFAQKVLNPQPFPPRSESASGMAYLPKPPKGDLGLVDWTPTLTTPIKNQGYCGSCWALSATEQIESDAMRMLGSSYILASEQIIQCDSASQGCNGGHTESGFNYVKKAGGIEQESDYPYTSTDGVTGKCQANKDLFVVGVESYTTIKGESSMASYVQSTGPLSACIDATTWQTYVGGVLTQCGNDVNHCVQVVGVDASTDGSGFWKVRNSWGTSWGENGYIRLAYGKNLCSISYDPIFSTVFKV